MHDIAGVYDLNTQSERMKMPTNMHIQSTKYEFSFSGLPPSLAIMLPLVFIFSECTISGAKVSVLSHLLLWLVGVCFCHLLGV